MEKENRSYCSSQGLLWQISAAQCHAKSGWTWGEQGRKFEGLDVWFLSSQAYLTQRCKFRCPPCILLYSKFPSYTSQLNGMNSILELKKIQICLELIFKYICKGDNLQQKFNKTVSCFSTLSIQKVNRSWNTGGSPPNLYILYRQHPLIISIFMQGVHLILH